MRRSWADPKGDGTVAAKQRPSYALRSKRTRLPPRRHLQTTPWPTPGSNMHRPAWIRLLCNVWFKPSRMPSQGSTLTAMPCPASVSSPKYTGGFSPATPSLGCLGSCAFQQNSMKRSYKAKQPSKSAPKRISSAPLSSTTRRSCRSTTCASALPGCIAFRLSSAMLSPSATVHICNASRRSTKRSSTDLHLRTVTTQELLVADRNNLAGAFRLA